MTCLSVRYIYAESDCAAWNVQSRSAYCPIRSLLNPLPSEDDQESCYSENEAWFIGYERDQQAA